MKTHISTRERGGDNVGNRTSMLVTDPNGTRVHVYSYDATYQLTHVDYPSGYDYLALGRSGVIHIGFLSSTKILSPSRNSFRP